VDDFGSQLDSMSYAGLNVPMGQAWRAKDLILQNMVARAQGLVQKYGQEDLPDPALLFTLSNTYAEGSNFYAFQKTYEGAFSMDVFFDSQASPAAAKLDCEHNGPYSPVILASQLSSVFFALRSCCAYGWSASIVSRLPCSLREHLSTRCKRL
jgi:hypothetical protein